MDISVQIEERQDGIILNIANQYFVQTTIEQLASYIDSALNDPVETVVRNVALRLALSNVDLNDVEAMKTEINNATFKAVI
jgi:hypothetical protein